MKFRKLLPIAFMATALLIGCGDGGTKDFDDGTHHVQLKGFKETNIELDTAWHNDGSTRTLDLGLTVEGDNKAYSDEAEIAFGNLKVTSSNSNILTVAGLGLTSVKDGAFGSVKVTIKWYKTVKVLDLTITQKPDVPEVVTGLTCKQISDAGKTAKNTVLYEVRGKVGGWHSKTEWNQFGEFDVVDDSGSVYFYGSYVNTPEEPAGFDWDGTVFREYKKNFNALTADLTKDLKVGDDVVLIAMHDDNFDNFYGVFVSVNPAPFIPAESVTVNPTNVELTEGENADVGVTILPANCNQPQSWTSNDEIIATVIKTSTGAKITGVTAGTATITVTVGEKSATINVTVNAPSDGSKIPTYTAGTNSYNNNTVNGKAALKAGTSSKTGDFNLAFEAGAVRFVFKAASWKGTPSSTLDFTVSGATLSKTSFDLKADDAVQGSGPNFPIANEDAYAFEITITNATADFSISITSTKRFVMWDYKYYLSE